MAWTDLSAAFGYGTKLTSAQMQNLRDNITAQAQGDSGAPKQEAISMTDYLPVIFTSCTSLERSNALWGPMVFFPFVCPEGPNRLGMHARIRGGDFRFGVESSYSAGGTAGAGAYSIENCGEIDISGLTPGTAYLGQLEGKSTGTLYIAGISIYHVSSG